MTELDPRVPALWADFERRLKALEGSQQLGSSTVGDTDEDAVPVDEVVADAAVSNDALIDLQDAAADANDGVSQLGEILDASMAELDARLELADVNLDLASENIAASMQEIAANFATAVQGLSDKVDTVVVGAGGSLILYSASDPQGTAPPGSTWFKVVPSDVPGAPDRIVGQWQQTATDAAPVWTPRALDSEVIANLDVGKLTAGQAAIAELVAQKIAASTADIQTVNVGNLFVTEEATLQQAVIEFLFAKVVQAKQITADMIDVGSLNGLVLTGVSVQTGTVGARVVLSGSSLRFYDANNKRAGAIYGQSNGDAGGLIQIGPVDESGGISVGTYYLPLAGTAAMHADSAHVGQLYVDRLINPATNGPFSGVYIGTRTQSIGSATTQGVGVFGNVPGTETSFMTMDPSGRFTLAPGSYVITITMTLGGGKATGRTFLELVDIADTSTPLFRNLMPPNVGEDTVSTAGTVYTDGTRRFRVQTYQISDGPNQIKYTLGVTRIS